MNRKTQNLRVHRSRLAGILEQLVAAAALDYIALPADVLRLFVNAQGSLAAEPALGDMTEATFSGYAAVDIAGGTGYSGAFNAGPNLSVIAAQGIFIADGAIAGGGEMITGYYLTNTAGDELVGWEEFDEPVGIGVPDDGLEMDVYISLSKILSTGGFLPNPAA